MGDPSAQPSLPIAGVSTAQTETTTDLPAAKAKSKKRASRLPDDWTPAAADQQYALARGYSAREVDDIAANFREHWTNKTGRAALKRRWSQAWQTWIRNETHYRPPDAKNHEGTNDVENPENRDAGRYRRSSSRKASPSDRWLAGASAVIAGGRTKPDDDA
jgi:hypothetical protein